MNEIEQLKKQLAEAQAEIKSQKSAMLKAEQAQNIHLAKNSAYVKIRLMLVEKALQESGLSWKGLWSEAKKEVDAKLKSGELVLNLPTGEPIPSESYKF